MPRNGDTPTGALALRPRRAADCIRVVEWVPDNEAMLLFTGRRLLWPLTVAQLLLMDQLPGFTAWVLTENEVPVGHFDLTVADSEARIGRVIIDPSRRGNGLAHALIRSAVEQARAAGASSVALNVIAGNEPAIRTYRGAGFRMAADGGHPDAHRMTLTL